LEELTDDQRNLFIAKPFFIFALHMLKMRLLNIVHTVLIKCLLAFALTLGSISFSFSSHIVGGEMYYDYLGPNLYQLSVKIYRDCGGMGYPSNIVVGIFNNSGTLVQSETISFPGATVLPIDINDPCTVPPQNICIEQAIYTKQITLPPNAGGYHLAFELCCRAPSIDNLLSPASQGMTLTSYIPGQANNSHINSSPRFSSLPPLLVCNNRLLDYDYSATDPDGDSLVYTLTHPFDGNGTGNAAPPPPPYFSVNYAGGYNATNPFGTTISTSLDPNTGQFLTTPNGTGTYAVGVMVSEYRNGVLLSETRREFVFEVVNCTYYLEAIIPAQMQMNYYSGTCTGLTVDFDNNSYGGNDYFWDFGDALTFADTSNLLFPSYQYPDSGFYLVTFIVNRGAACTDTAYVNIRVDYPVLIDLVYDDSICEKVNEFDFSAISNYTHPESDYNWYFTTNATPSTVLQQDQVSSVQFSSPGTYNIKFRLDQGRCMKDTIFPVTLLPDAQADFEWPSDQLCNGMEVPFTNLSNNNGGVEWEFGEVGPSDVSTLQNPIWTYSATGNYQIDLYAYDNLGCHDTISKSIFVLPAIDIDISFDDSICSSLNRFNFSATSNFPVSTSQYIWDFGASASPSGVNNQSQVSGIEYAAAGTYNVNFVLNNGTCMKDSTFQVTMLPNTDADFSWPSDYLCNGLDIPFINLSGFNAGNFWNFGESFSGDNSTLTNPMWVFSEEGSFDVTLISLDDFGCNDTITKNISVYPELNIDFTHTDSLCIDNNAFQFFGQLTGPQNAVYTFDFGPNATPSTSNNTNVSGVHFTTAGINNVILSAKHLTCEEEIIKNTRVFNLPTVDFTHIQDQPCLPIQVEFTSSVTNEMPLTYLWNFGNDNTSTDEHPNEFYTYKGNFDVSLTITGEYGCTNEVTKNKEELIIARNLPVADFDIENEEILECSPYLVLQDHSEYAEYNSIFINEREFILDTVVDIINYTFGEPGTYWIAQYVSNDAGCHDEYYRSITVEPNSMYLPNAFTPNQDKYNNGFGTTFSRTPDVWHMVIYNRWGQLVFETNDPTEYWTGYKNGQPLLDGVYTYRLKWSSCGGETDLYYKNGIVHLLK
jgi:gliding motility-associated-like protein